MAYTLAIAGLGAIGLKVARAVDAGAVPGITLTAVSAKDIARLSSTFEAAIADPRDEAVALATPHSLHAT